jgi:hypothetical protein
MKISDVVDGHMRNVLRKVVEGPHDNAVRAHLNGAYKAPREPLEARATRYVAENPAVWGLFQKFTFEALNKGLTKVGAKMVGERIRWESMVSGNDGFKINNSYLAHMARRFMRENPLYGQVFATRVQKGRTA